MTRCFMLLLILVPFGGSGCGESASGKLEFAENPVQYGVVPLGSQKLSLAVFNKGDDVLRIKSIAASCTCTVAKSSDSVIQPHASGNIELELHVVSPGPGGAILTIHSSDPQSPHNLSFSWYGEHPPKTVPNTIAARVSETESFQRTIRVIYTCGDVTQPLKILKAYSTIPEIQIAEDSETAEPKYSSHPGAMNQAAVTCEKSFVVSCDQPLEDSVDGECVIEVEQSGTRYSLTVPVQIQLTGKIQSIPPEINIVVDQTSSDVTREATLVVNSAEIPVVARCPDYLECQISPVDSLGEAAGDKTRKTYRLIVRLKKPSSESLSGLIDIGLPDDQSRHLEIPVAVRVVPEAG